MEIPRMSEGQMKKGAATENHTFFIIIPSNRRSQKSFAQPPDRVSPNNVPKSQKLSWKSKKMGQGKSHGISPPLKETPKSRK